MDKSKKPVVSVPEPSTALVAEEAFASAHTSFTNNAAERTVVPWMIGWLRKLSYCRPRQNPKRLNIAACRSGKQGCLRSNLRGQPFSGCWMFNSAVAMTLVSSSMLQRIMNSR